MASREIRRKKSRNSETLVHQREEKNKRHPAIWFGSLLILLIIVLAFIALPIMSNYIPGGLTTYATYGQYSITNDPRAQFSRQIGYRQQQAGNEQQYALQIYNEAFKDTVAFYARVTLADNSGIVVSEKEVDQSIIDSGRFSPEGFFDRELYQELDNNSKIRLKEDSRQALLAQTVSEGSAFPLIDNGELDFLKDMLTEEYQVAYVSFPYSDYPEELLLEFAADNEQLFQRLHLERISSSSKEEMDKVEQRLIADPDSFMEAAATALPAAAAPKESTDTTEPAAENNNGATAVTTDAVDTNVTAETAAAAGTNIDDSAIPLYFDMDWQFYQQLSYSFSDEETLKTLAMAEIGTVTPIIENGGMWAIYRVKEKSQTVQQLIDSDSDALVNAVLDYMLVSETGMLQDNANERAQQFYNKLTETTEDFNTAAADNDVHVSNYFPLIYGQPAYSFGSQSSPLFKTITTIDNDPTLALGQNNFDFLQQLTNMAVGDSAGPLVIGQNVIVYTLRDKKNLPPEEVDSSVAFLPFASSGWANEAVRNMALDSPNLTDTDNFSQTLRSLYSTN